MGPFVTIIHCPIAENPAFIFNSKLFSIFGVSIRGCSTENSNDSKGSAIQITGGFANLTSVYFYENTGDSTISISNANVLIKNCYFLGNNNFFSLILSSNSNLILKKNIFEENMLDLDNITSLNGNLTTESCFFIGISASRYLIYTKNSNFEIKESHFIKIKSAASISCEKSNVTTALSDFQNSKAEENLLILDSNLLLLKKFIF